MTLPRLALFAAVAIAVAGCPKSPRPSRVLPAPPATGDPAARARFDQAQARFERDGAGTAAVADEFAAIAREFPDDPIAPFARLYAGRAALRAGRYDDAIAALAAAVDDPAADAALRRRARLFLGLARGYAGDAAGSIAALDDPDAPVDDGERAERFAVLAEAHAALGDAPRALAHYDRWYPLATLAERSFILARVRALAAELDEAAAERTLAATADPGPARLALAERVAAVRTARGDRAGAADARAIVDAVRERLGLGPAPAADGGDPHLVGAALPLSGRRARVGDAALAGLGVATGAVGDLEPSPFAVSTRDTRSLADAAADAVDALAREGAVAVVGPLDAASVRAAAERAAQRGVPLVALDALGGADIPVDSPFVFHVVLSPVARAEALARHAAGRGVRRFAILAPDSGYGRAVADAFAAQVDRLGGTVIVRASYPPGARSFSAVVEPIAGKPWDALFVPDTAAQLELIAPALARANLMVGPVGARPPKQGRRVHLLSTAEALRPRFARTTGRYSEGAILAPGFYADDRDPIVGRYVERFRRAFGRDPAYLDAYAYDAASLVRAAVAAGARSRGDVAAALSQMTVDGVTGTIRFGADRRRADDGLLFTVVLDDDGEYRIRALR